MDFLNQKVVHKKFGEGVVCNHEHPYFDVRFPDAIRRFSFPQSFEGFLHFTDQETQKAVEDMMSEEKDQVAKAKKIQPVYNLALTNMSNKPGAFKKMRKVEKPNIVFKCNYCDGGSNRYHIGYMGACSDEQIRYNIQVARHSWCSSPDCPCSQYLRGEIDGFQLDEMCRDGAFVCYESQMLRDWTAFAGFVLKGDRKEEPKKIRNIQLNSLAVLTTRMPDMAEEDRFVFGVFLVDDADEGNSVNEGFVKSNSKYRLELSPTEAVHIKFWNYHANDNHPEKAAWSQGLYRYINDTEAVQMLRDIVAIKQVPSAKKFAEEFLAHFCKIKQIDLNSIPAPYGALKR